jgi:hypothetical protein
MRLLARLAVVPIIALASTTCDGSPTLVEEDLLYAQFARQGPPVGGCPPGFAIAFGNDHDLNQDGRVCQKTVGRGHVVTIDNVRRHGTKKA